MAVTVAEAVAERVLQQVAVGAAELVGVEGEGGVDGC
jgi:hypothetical protein